jgi:uncharacterized protein (DUF1330 family)
MALHFLEAPMTAYAVFEVTVTSRDWQDKYLQPTAKLIEKHGGRYIALGQPQKLEGGRAAPHVLVILEFPSEAAAKSWYEDPEYKPLIALRRGGSLSEALLVAGK